MGWAKLPNEYIERGVVAHLPGAALKVLLAIILAARSRGEAEGTCFPSVKTLARWSGVPRSRISGWTKYLGAHGLIEKRWISVGGKPRMLYRIERDDMIPDLRGTCKICAKLDMNADGRGSCVIRDAKGRLSGRLQITDGRDSVMIPDGRDSVMITDGRGRNQSELDITTRGTSGLAEARPPRGVAEAEDPPGEPGPGGPPDLPYRVRFLREILTADGVGDTKDRVRLARGEGYGRLEIQEALNEVGGNNGIEPASL